MNVDLTYKMPEAINTKKFRIEKANIALTVNSIEEKGSNKRIYFAKSEDQSQSIGNFNVISGVTGSNQPESHFNTCCSSFLTFIFLFFIFNINTNNSIWFGIFQTCIIM